MQILLYDVEFKFILFLIIGKHHFKRELNAFLVTSLIFCFVDCKFIIFV